MPYLKKSIFYLLPSIMFLVSLGQQISYGQSGSPDTLVKWYDTSEVVIRSFDEQTLTEFREDPDFEYANPPPETGIWSEIVRFVTELVGTLFSNSGFFVILRFGVIAIVVILIVMRLMKARIRSVFYRSKYKDKISIIELSEDIHELDLDELIAEEIRKANFRLATRYLYLKLLKLLSDNELIRWRLDKTNRDYFRELKGSHHRDSFRKLSLHYEYIWYGDFPVGSVDFSLVIDDFDVEFKKLKTDITNG